MKLLKELCSLQSYRLVRFLFLIVWCLAGLITCDHTGRKEIFAFFFFFQVMCLEK